MSLFRFVLELSDNLLGLSYTLVMRSSFAASWGVGSRLGRHARLVEPQMINVGSGVSLGDNVSLW